MDAAPRMVGWAEFAKSDGTVERIEFGDDSVPAKAVPPTEDTGAIVPGDVVRLRSGSLPMTVTAIRNGDAFVAWFCVGCPLQKASVPLIALEKNEAQA